MIPKEPRFHYRHWLFRLPLMRNYRGICLGRNVYFKEARENVGAELIRHELIHQEQISRDGMVRFYARYLRDYLRLVINFRNHAAAYRAIPYEVEAYARQNEKSNEQETV